jgi:hypothetical protein
MSWLRALHSTYRYQPVVLTTASTGQPLSDGIVFCRVSSWMTGSRLVSLPFADHCEPLLDNPESLPAFSHWLQAECESTGARYVEIRPLTARFDRYAGVPESNSFCFHELDLAPSLEQIRCRTHKDCFQRKVRRAEKERLSYEVGQSDRLLNEFYKLMVITRRRHRLLPQPRSWFRNLLRTDSSAEIRVVRKNDVPVASIFTLRHGGTAVYKYGCSDARVHNLGGMTLLFWRFIQESKSSGVLSIDLGRSDWDNPGLVAFKDHMGAQKREVSYFRYRNCAQKSQSAAMAFLGSWNHIFKLPDHALAWAGRVVYRHLG